MAKTRITLDPGHGYPDNRGGVLFDEGTNNWEFSNILKKKLEATGNYIVNMTKNKVTDDPSLKARGNAGKGSRIFLSIHTNAHKDRNVTGVEVFDDIRPSKANKKMAQDLCNAIQKTVDTKNRGVKYRRYSDGAVVRDAQYGQDNWYGVIRNGLAGRNMLVEIVFHTNYGDSQKFLNKKNEVADAIVNVLNAHCGYNSMPSDNITLNTAKENPIANQKPTVTKAQMVQWLIDRKAHPNYVDLVDTFYNVSVRNKLDPALVLAQSAKETANGNFGGVLDASFKNPCGMKTNKGGDNSDPNAHQRFDTWEQGIQAQCDHLNLYAGAEGYPKKDTPDPRHFPSIKGKAKTVEALSGKWAGASNYGSSIVERMKAMQATIAEEPKIEPKEEPKEVIKPAFEYAVCYMNDGDLPNAIVLMNVLGDKGVLVKNKDASNLNVETVIQVGGFNISGADVKLFGENRAETLNEVNKFIQEEL